MSLFLVKNSRVSKWRIDDMYAGNGLIPTFLWSARRRALFVPVFQQTYRVVMMRMLLEGRTYDKLPVSRFLYPITTRKWLSMAKVMLLENVFLFLWTFHHHRRVHQTVFLPYGALHRRRKSEYRGTGGHQPVQAHDEGSQVGVFRGRPVVPWLVAAQSVHARLERHLLFQRL